MSRFCSTLLRKKGKGYAPALAKPDKFHGLGKFTLETGETAKASTPTYSELLGQTLSKFADSNKKIMAITAAMPSGTGLFSFLPLITRINTLTSGSRRNTQPFSPVASRRKVLNRFLTIYSTFMQRAYDMVIHDIALQNLNVALCMDPRWVVRR